MKVKMTREDCITLIKLKFTELHRIPKKTDFTLEQVAMIKSYFGPWTRALEESGVKEISLGRTQKLEAKKDKKIRTKIRKREIKLENKATEKKATEKEATSKPL